MFLSNAKRIFILIFLLGMTPAVSSEETWIVEDIRISGLQRISAGSIFSNIPMVFLLLHFYFSSRALSRMFPFLCDRPCMMERNSGFVLFHMFRGYVH